MNGKLRTPLFFLILILVFPISPVLCDDASIDLMNLPQWLANALNISEFASGILCSIIFLAMFLFPFIFVRSRKAFIGVLIVGFSCLSFAVAVTWLPVWILLMTTLLVAVSYSGLWKKVLG